MNFLDLIWIIPLFPAVGFVINGLVRQAHAKDCRRHDCVRRGFALFHLFGGRGVSADAAGAGASIATR